MVKNHALRFTWIASALVLMLLCAQPAQAHTGKSVVISMTDAGYVPEEVAISVGDAVEFRNDSTKERWPASNIHPTHKAYPGTSIDKCGTEDSMFDACRALAPGESFTFTFERSGKWRCHDHLNPGDTCMIIVEGEDRAAGSVVGTIIAYVLELQEKIRLSVLRKYYEMQPEKLAERLAQTHIFSVADDPVALKEIVAIAGSKKIMDDLLDEAGGGSVRDCHQEAHAIGWIAFGLFGAGVFQEQIPTCHSGFIHGAMEAFIATTGTDDLAENISGLCSGLPTSFAVFECLHGVGHGVMAYEDYDMPAALHECADLETLLQQKSCYGGVFMENIIAAQGNGAKGGHDTAWVNQDDPYFPCNAVSKDSDVQEQCYLMQTSWMLTQNGYDFSATGQLCLKIPDNAFVETCFRSLGRDIAGQVLRDPNMIVATCRLSAASHLDSCIRGAVGVVLDFWGPEVGDRAEQVCLLLTDDEPRDGCVDMVKEKLERIGK